MKRNRIVLYFAIFGAAFAAFSCIRAAYRLLPCEFLDLICWFLAAPVIFFQVFLGLPEFMSAPLILIYYLLTGIIFSKAAVKNKKIMTVFLIGGLIILHLACGIAAGKFLGNLFQDIFKAFIG